MSSLVHCGDWSPHKIICSSVGLKRNSFSIGNTWSNPATTDNNIPTHINSILNTKKFNLKTQWPRPMNMEYVSRDVTKFAFEFDSVRTSNVFSRFEICRIFSRTRRRIQTSGLHDQTVTNASSNGPAKMLSASKTLSSQGRHWQRSETQCLQMEVSECVGFNVPLDR